MSYVGFCCGWTKIQYIELLLKIDVKKIKSAPYGNRTHDVSFDGHGLYQLYRQSQFIEIRFCLHDLKC